MLPGMFLSQPPTATSPSMHWPLTATSIASAMTSRDTSEYFIPSVPMAMPSVTVGKPKTCGITPAFFGAALLEVCFENANLRHGRSAQLLLPAGLAQQVFRRENRWGAVAFARKDGRHAH